MLFAPKISQNTFIFFRTKLNAGLCKVAYVAINSISIPQCAFVGLHTNRKCIRTRAARNSIGDGHAREVNAFLRNDIENIEIVGISIFLDFGVPCLRGLSIETKKAAGRIKRSSDDEHERTTFMQLDFARCAARFANVSKI